jgi:peroxiredoxin
MNRWYFFFFVILIGGGAWVWVSRIPAAQAMPRGPQPAVDYPAPDFTLPTVDGSTVTLSALRGTPVVLNFWATWCDPCRREMPALQATAANYDGQVVVLGIDQGEEPAVVQRFVDEYGLTYPILLDEEFAISERYAIGGMPTTFFIDAEGVIRHLWVGEMNRITLAEGIAQIAR